MGGRWGGRAGRGSTRGAARGARKHDFEAMGIGSPPPAGNAPVLLAPRASRRPSSGRQRRSGPDPAQRLEQLSTQRLGSLELHVALAGVGRQLRRRAEEPGPQPLRLRSAPASRGRRALHVRSRNDRMNPHRLGASTSEGSFCQERPQRKVSGGVSHSCLPHSGPPAAGSGSIARGSIQYMPVDIRDSLYKRILAEPLLTIN